jgi:hypothetical protein
VAGRTLRRRPPQRGEAQVSTDGTRKWLLRTADGHDFEMVFIPDADRGTLCVSSQVGCTLNCRFCHTGTMKLVRNLTPGEIVGQVMLARDALGEWPKGSMAGLESDEGRRRLHLRRAPADQHRDDGHGRAALQFRQRARCAQAGDGRRWPCAVQAPHHAVDRRRRADDGPRGAKSA